MTHERRNSISQFLYSFGTNLTLTCHFPSQATGSARDDGVFGCCGNECQHLPMSLRGQEMLVIDGPVKIALHSSCQNRVYDTMNEKTCYYTLASNLSGICFLPTRAANKPNYEVMVETILDCCQVKNEHIIHVAEIGCRLSISADDTKLDPLFERLQAMKLTGLKVELSQIDIAFVTKIAPNHLVQANFSKKNKKLSRSVLNGTNSVVYPLHNLPPLETSKLKDKDLKGTLLVKQKKWANNKTKVIIAPIDEENDNYVAEMDVVNLFLAESTEKYVRPSIETHSSSVHSIKGYSTVAHSLMQHRTGLPMSLKGMFGIVTRSIDSIQTLLKNLNTGFENVSNIVKTSGIGFRIEVSIRPQLDDPIRVEGHFNDFLLLIHLAIRDFFELYSPKIHIMKMDRIHSQTTLLMRQATSMLKFRHIRSFADIYADPKQHEWFRSHLSMLMVSIGISPSYRTKYINNWLGDRNRFNPFNMTVSPVVDDDIESYSTSSITFRFSRILNRLGFSKKGIKCLTQYVTQEPAIEPKKCFHNLSFKDKHLLAFHLWGNIIPGLSKTSSPKSNTNKKSIESEEKELDSEVLKDVQIYDSWWNEFEDHTNNSGDTLVTQSGRPEDPLSLVIHSLIKISILWYPGRIAFDQLLCRYIISSHDCTSLRLGEISDQSCYTVVKECAQNRIKLGRTHFQHICGELCPPSIVGNSSIAIFQKLLCETYHFPWSDATPSLSQDRRTNYTRNKILNQVLDADIVSTIAETTSSYTFYRSLDQSKITIKKVASVVSVCKRQNLIPEFRDENLYKVLAMSVNTHHRTCFRQFLRSRINKNVNIQNNFLTSAGTTQIPFFGKHSFGELEKSYNFKVDHRGKLSDFPMTVHYIPEIIVSLTCYIYQKHILFYNMTKNETFYFMYCDKNHCSIKYEIKGTEVYPRESSASISYSGDNKYEWNGDVKYRRQPKYLNYLPNLVDTHPFQGKCSTTNSMNILPHRSTGVRRPMMVSIRKLLSELDKLYINNELSDDSIGVMDLLTEMCISSSTMKLFSKRAQNHCTELQLPLPTLVSHLNKVSWSELSHGILCPLTCLKYQNLIFAVFGTTAKKKWTKFYFYNSITNEVDFVQMDRYNVFHDLHQVLYLCEGQASSSYYKVSITPELMTEHKLHYYNSLSGCYSHLAPEQYTVAFNAMASKFAILVVSQDDLQLLHFDHNPRKVTIVRTVLTSENANTFQEWVQKGVEEPALIFIFPPGTNDENWTTCIVHNPCQDTDTAEKQLTEVISTIDSGNGVHTKHCLKGVKSNCWESCYLMILYAYLGSLMKTGIQLETVLKTLQTEVNLIFKIQSWVSKILEGKLFKVPAWLDQLTDSSSNEHQMTSQTKTRNQIMPNYSSKPSVSSRKDSISLKVRKKSKKRKAKPDMRDRINVQIGIATDIYTDSIVQLKCPNPFIPTTLRSVIGLKNPANDCYVNSTIQLLYGMKCTREYFSSMKFLNNQEFASPEILICYLKEGGSIGLSLGTLFARMSRERIGLSANDFKEAVVTLNVSCTSSYDNDSQHDVHEFLINVLDILNDTFKKYHREDPILSNWFECSQKSLIVCSKCQHSLSNDTDKSFVIALCIDGKTLESCLASHLKSEVVLEYRCDSCKERDFCTRTVVLTNGPIVIFLLKRFTLGMEKNCQKVVFPTKNLLISNNISYDLAAIICHQGESSSSGHYVISMRIGDDWFEFNDNNVSPLDLEEVTIMSKLQANAYILVYCQSDKFEQLVSTKEESSRIELGNSHTNNCFMNVGIQCLFGITEFRSLFIDGIVDEEKCKENRVSFALCSLFQEMGKKTPVIDVSTFKNILRQNKGLSKFANCDQHNAVNFLISLIEHMCEELDTDHNSMISPIFHTIVIHRIYCSKCDKVEVRQEVLVNLLMSGKGTSLFCRLDEYFENHTFIQDWNAACECKASSRSTSHFQGGKVLILTFEETNPNVTFDIHLDMSKYSQKDDKNEYLFELYGLISHIPSNEKCPYVLYLKLSRQWYMFDDKKIQKREEAVLTQTRAYCLIYKQQKSENSIKLVHDGLMI